MSEKTDYAYPTIEEYEKLVGFNVNQAFRCGWDMARATNAMFGIEPTQPTAESAGENDKIHPMTARPTAPNPPQTAAGQSLGAMPCSALPPVLDACCGGRMMWFSKKHPMALYMDKRAEVVKWEANETIKGKEAKKHRNRDLEIAPDVVADFTEMPFPDGSFSLVVFDPPHFNSLGENSRLAKTYGRLFGDWECDIEAGFRECFRVLKEHGTLIFKWNSTDIPLAKVLELAGVEPLFGHTTGRQAKTHWVTFLKQNTELTGDSPVE